MLISFGFFTPTTMVILLVIALIIFGPGKLPEIGKSLGKGINEFKAASEEPVQKEENIVGQKDKQKDKIEA